MTIKEACELVLQSTQLNTKNKILFLDMGKPIKIIEIIRKIFLIAKKPNQKLKIKYIGNKFNEKISEKLSIKNKYSKTKFKKIYSIDEDEISNKKINLLIDYLNKKTETLNNKKLFRFIKKFV